MYKVINIQKLIYDIEDALRMELLYWFRGRDDKLEQCNMHIIKRIKKTILSHHSDYLEKNALTDELIEEIMNMSLPIPIVKSLKNKKQ